MRAAHKELRAARQAGYKVSEHAFSDLRTCARFAFASSWASSCDMFVAEHLMPWKDGRFQNHLSFPFAMHNMLFVMRSSSFRQQEQRSDERHCLSSRIRRRLLIFARLPGAQPVDELSHIRARKNTPTPRRPRAVRTARRARAVARDVTHVGGARLRGGSGGRLAAACSAVGPWLGPEARRPHQFVPHSDPLGR